VAFPAKKSVVKKKLPAHLHRYLLPLGTSFFMTFLVSGVASYRALGLVPDFLGIWMSSWMISWAIAFPTMLLAMPVVRGWLRHIVEEI
jgi:Protein of unknown function (DUF2798)